jgi:hypothetical protein
LALGKLRNVVAFSAEFRDGGFKMASADAGFQPARLRFAITRTEKVSRLATTAKFATTDPASAFRFLFVYGDHKIGA